MKRYPIRRAIVAAVVLLASAFMVVYLGSRSRPAPGPDFLTDIRSIETLRTEFNRDAGQIRLVILLNPT
ncbi:MAG TPA: hypothetical protein VJ022_11175 [Anaerolineales bacterium]|nr:hypothetical protein [Anaerolineales bacterium]